MQKRGVRPIESTFQRNPGPFPTCQAVFKASDGHSPDQMLWVVFSLCHMSQPSLFLILKYTLKPAMSGKRSEMLETMKKSIPGDFWHSIFLLSSDKYFHFQKLLFLYYVENAHGVKVAAWVLSLSLVWYLPGHVQNKQPNVITSSLASAFCAGCIKPWKGLCSRVCR